MRRSIQKGIASLAVAVLMLASTPALAYAAGFDAEACEEPLAADAPEEEGNPEETPGDSEGDGQAPGEDTLPALETELHIVYMEGSEDLVNPDGALRRSEAAKIICSLLKETEEGEASPAGLPGFSDVPPAQWFTPFVQKLAALGVMNGYPDGTFGPNNPITRAEFVQVLSQFFPPAESSVSFSDVAEDHWAYPAISTAVANGWTQGYPDGTFAPWKNITRAEAVTMVNRVLGRQADKGEIDGQGRILRFLDLPLSHWAYYEIMEAALPHTYTASAAGEAWETYTVPAAQREKGPQYFDGELY